MKVIFGSFRCFLSQKRETRVYSCKDGLMVQKKEKKQARQLDESEAPARKFALRQQVFYSHRAVQVLESLKPLVFHGLSIL
jgi:hypothetical protein